MHNDRNSGQPCGPTTKNSGFGTVGVDDRGSEASQKLRELEERYNIPDELNLSPKFRQNMHVYMRQASSVFRQEPARTGN
jgi:hypothetical protein